MKAVVPVVLIIFGAVELLAAVLTLVESPTAATAAELNAPVFLLPVTVAVALSAVESNRSSRLAVAGGAAAALLARLVLTICTFAMGGPEITAAQSLLSTAGLGLGIALAAVAVRGLIMNRDLASAVEDVAMAAPPPVDAPAGPEAPMRAPMTGPANAAGPWSTATTPWPRADEDDPDGTLIRPPRR